MTSNKVSQKMTFRSFDENTYKEKNAIAEYVVMMNPEKVSRTLAAKTDASKSRGAVGSDGKWQGLKSETFKFDLVFDGTGLVDANRTDVEKEIDEFLKVVYLPDKKKGKQAFVEISYGNTIVNCKLESMSIDYQIFNRAGDPIRAKLTCSFTSVNLPTERKPAKKSTTNQCCPCPPQCCGEVVDNAKASDADSLSSQIQK